MKKVFSPISVFFQFVLLLLLPLFTNVPVAFAAGETYTWAGNSILVNGGELTGPVTLNVGNQNNNYTGTLTINGNFPNGKIPCQITIILLPAADNKTGRIISAAPRGNPQCTNADVAKFSGAQVTIGGTPPNRGPETNAQKKVHVVISVPDATKAPNTLVITIGKDKITASKKVDDAGNGHFTADFTVEAGTHKVCAPPILSCQTFTKVKYEPKNLAFGDIAQLQVLNVEATISFILQNGQTCTVTGYKVDLKKDGKTIQTITLDEQKVGNIDGSLDNSLGGLSDAKVTLRGKFEKVKDGDYKVCLVASGECKDVKNPKDKEMSPNPVTFDYKLANSANICAAIGEKYPPITDPPPPSPPCASFGEKGQCTTVFSAFGPLATDPEKFIVTVFAILLSAAGGIALFLIIRAGYMLMTSRGKPEQIQTGRDQLIAAIVGLIFFIFSFVILQVIGVDILRIPTDKGAAGGQPSNNGDFGGNGNGDAGGEDFGGGDFGN